MGLTVFFALAILGIDFLIYAFFQWTWGDKRRAIARQVAAHRKEYDTQLRRPYLVSSEGTPPASHRRSEIFPRNSPAKRIA